MRIIGGKHKKRKIIPVPGINTRPTTDRVRETLFNILSDKIEGSKVLDVFAGTGAFGLEAISRGADFAVFFEKNIKAVSVIKSNIENLREDKKTRVVKCDVTRKIAMESSFEGIFTIAFLDPPYEKGMIKKTLINLDKSKLLANGATCVVEHSKSENTEEIDSFLLSDERIYGRTKVSFFNYNKQVE